MAKNRVTFDLEADPAVQAIAELLANRGIDATGYAYDYAIIGDCLVVASLDASKEYRRTEIDIYDLEALRRWKERIDAYLGENPDADEDDAAYETEHE